MTSEPPEFHTKTLSPLSPMPVHPPEPSSIPVLQNQTDPVFNMTATHILSQSPNKAVVDMLEPINQADSPSADSSFSDAYREQPNTEGNGTEKLVSADAEASDDYAMTFDSDGEGQADNEDVSQANIDTDTNIIPLATPVLSSSSVAMDAPTNTAQQGPTLQSIQPAPSFAYPVPPDPAATQSFGSAALTALDPAAHQSHTSVDATESDLSKPQGHTYDDVANGGIDIQQLLDNITANAEKNEFSSAAVAPNPLPKGNSNLAAHASLPPRPQLPQMRSNQYQDDIQKYNAAPGSSESPSSFRPTGVLPSLIAAGAPGTSTDPRGGLPPPPSASFRNHPQPGASTHSTSLLQINRSSGQDYSNQPIDSREDADDLDQRWGTEIQVLYDKFLEDERMYVLEGMWDRFPVGSRLFIGNLPSEKVTKRDLFHVFHRYGRLAQVSIKQAYGFIQYHDVAPCKEALRVEQGAEVRGRKMHLEISKPQRNTRNAQNPAPTTMQQRRSRSPDYARGDNRGGNRQGPGSRSTNTDRYDGRSAQQMRHDEYGRPLRSRDDYRPSRRSPSPPRGNFRDREEYEPRRDPYGRDRGRDRSRSPYGERSNGSYRQRSPSPGLRGSNADAELELPRRDPRNVPDAQLILMEQLDRAFVSWVEGEMQKRGIKTEVMFLGHRLSLEAVIRRQILEGVHAVSLLDMRCQNSSKIPLRVFDRQGGVNNVRFDEYQDLEPRIAGELVLRTKQTQPQPPSPQYAPSQYTTTQTYQTSAPITGAPNLASLVGQIDNATLQQLLGSMNSSQQHNVPAAAANSSIDLAGLLGGLQQQPSPQQSYQPQGLSYTNQNANSALASLLGNAHSAVQPQPQQNELQQSAQQVQNIMAQLAKFGGR